MSLLSWANAVAFSLGGQAVKWSDLLGNILALATVSFAVRRSLLTWPVQIAGCVLLFGASLSAHLGGNAARQVVLAAAAAYGWRRWSHGRGADGVRVRLASAPERLVLLGVLALGTLAFAWLLAVTHTSWAPLPDAYIFIGSLVATVAQARGLVEFWAVWVAVDVVGVPLAFTHGLVVSGLVYGIFLVFCLVGVRDWFRRARLTGAAQTGLVAA